MIFIAPPSMSLTSGRPNISTSAISATIRFAALNRLRLWNTRSFNRFLPSDVAPAYAINKYLAESWMLSRITAFETKSYKIREQRE